MMARYRMFRIRRRDRAPESRKPVLLRFRRSRRRAPRQRPRHATESSQGVNILPEQVRWFRLCRSGLVEPFGSQEETAARLLGVQAQLPVAAGLALWNRTSPIDASDFSRARFERRTLVRFWGQRNTIHLYPAGDWPFLHTVFAPRASLIEKRFAKAGLMPTFRSLVTRTRKRLEAGEVLTYADVRSPKLESEQETWVISYVVFMQLVREGVACHGPEAGSQSSFVHREHWLPALDWSPPAAEDAFPELARRYFAAYGPAEAADLAFWYGGSLTRAKRWIAASGCVPVEVRGRPFWARAEDLDELARAAPPAGRWPVRLLYRFDPLVLATRDKTWLIDEAHYKRVWRPAAHVEAVLLVGGRIAGTWRYDRRPAGLDIALSPFAPLTKRVRREIERQAAGVARFLELPLANLEIEAPG